MRLTFSDAIKKAGLNSTEVAFKLGYSKQTWCAIENYKSQIKADKLLEFCDIVDCEPSDLIVKGYNY